MEFQPPTWAGSGGKSGLFPAPASGDPRVASAGHSDACPALALHLLPPRENEEQEKAVRLRRAKGGRGGYLGFSLSFFFGRVKNISEIR